jgi:transcriptional regulator with XRE-family HTH domain
MKDFLYRSEKIKEFRVKKGVTQVEFAQKVGVSKGYIAQIETGTRKVNIKFLDKLQAAFNIPGTQILEIIYGNPATDEILSEETTERVKPPPSPIELADLVSIVEAGIETEDFVSFPIQTFGSTIQAGGQFLGQIVIHKRVFGRRKNLAAVQLNGGKEIKVVIVGK